MSRRGFSPTLIVALIFAAVTSALQAQTTYIWTGQDNSNWTNAENWAGGVVPLEDTDETRIVFNDRSQTYVYYDEIYVNQLAFTGITRPYFIQGYYDTTHLGDGGIIYNPGAPVHSTLTGSVRLESSQIWNIQSGTFDVRDSISDTSYNYELSSYQSDHYAITKTGAGTLILGYGGYYYYNSSDWAGGLNLNEGKVVIQASIGYTYNSELGGYYYHPITSTAAGTGTLTFNGGTLVAQGSSSAYSDADQAVILQNQVVSQGLISTINQVPLYLSAGSGSTAPAAIPGTAATVMPTGGLTLAADTTIQSSGKPLYIESDIGETGGARKLTIDSSGAVILTGDNSYTGGTEVTKGVLIFGSAYSIPSNQLDSSTVGHLTARANGYIGFGDDSYTNSVQSTFLNDFNKADTQGVIGFDTDPQFTSPNVFTGNLDLTGFGAGARLGSATRAVLTGAITPQGTDYRFGGGGGFLQVNTALVDHGGNSAVVVDSHPETPLTLRLANEGGNSFSGGLSVTHSGVIFADGALPTQIPANNWTLATGGYIGTESVNTSQEDSDEQQSADIANFLQRFAPTTATGVIGFDAGNLTTYYDAWHITSAINLSGFGNGVYLGTATQAGDYDGISHAGLRLSGALTPTSDGIYRFAGYKGGALEVASALSGAGTQVQIGDPNSLGTFGDPIQEVYSSVTLSGDNSYGGGTTLYAGRLIVGQGKGGVGEVPTSALGTGTLVVQPHNITGLSHDGSAGPYAQLNAADQGADSMIIANAVQLNAGLSIGGHYNIALTGQVSGTGQLYIEDGRMLALTGDNTFSGGVYLREGTALDLYHDHASGTGPISFGGGSDGEVYFNTANPVIYGLASTHRSLLTLQADYSTLTINQNDDTSFNGEFRSASESDALRVVKSGTGTLRLDDGGLYFYHGVADAYQPPEIPIPGTAATIPIGPEISLEVQRGTLVIGQGFYLEDSDSTIRVTGHVGQTPAQSYAGTLQVDDGKYIYNPIILENGGRLAGNGNFTSGISISDGAILSPGGTGTAAISRLHFNHLELGGLGVYEWQVQGLPGSTEATNDIIDVYGEGTLVLNASAEAPFTIRVISLNTGGDGGILTGVDQSHGMYVWTLFTYDYFGETPFDPNAFVIDTSAFASDAPLGGSFTIFQNQESNQILLGFTPVPEPSTYALMALGLGFVVWSLRRRRA